MHLFHKKVAKASNLKPKTQVVAASLASQDQSPILVSDTTNSRRPPSNYYLHTELDAPKPKPNRYSLPLLRRKPVPAPLKPGLVFPAAAFYPRCLIPGYQECSGPQKRPSTLHSQPVSKNKPKVPVELEAEPVPDSYFENYRSPKHVTVPKKATRSCISQAAAVQFYRAGPPIVITIVVHPRCAAILEKEHESDNEEEVSVFLASPQPRFSRSSKVKNPSTKFPEFSYSSDSDFTSCPLKVPSKFSEPYVGARKQFSNPKEFANYFRARQIYIKNHPESADLFRSFWTPSEEAFMSSTTLVVSTEEDDEDEAEQGAKPLFTNPWISTVMDKIWAPDVLSQPHLSPVYSPVPSSFEVEVDAISGASIESLAVSPTASIALKSSNASHVSFSSIESEYSQGDWFTAKSIRNMWTTVKQQVEPKQSVLLTRQLLNHDRRALRMRYHIWKMRIW